MEKRRCKPFLTRCPLRGRNCCRPLNAGHISSSDTLHDEEPVVRSSAYFYKYCGQLGKQDNCQVAVSLSLANRHASLPIAWRLYLPLDWANDPNRRTKAGVPGTITFQTKPQIALDQIKA